MNIVLTGSIGNIGRPLTEMLVNNGHAVTVISSNASRQKDIELLGAKAVIGKLQDVDFLAETFKGADIVYLMETMEAVGDMFDKSVDFISAITAIGQNYKEAVERSGVKKVIHLSSIGAHTNKGTGIIRFHNIVETLLRQLPADISIKFIRPGSFYINLFSSIHNIRTQGAIISNYGGDVKEPWVSPKDIAAVIAGEVDRPFEGKTIRYVASDEISPNEIARALGEAIGKPDLKWLVIPSQQLLDSWLSIGFNEQVAKGFVELQESQGNGTLYEDYNQHKPSLGKVKLKDFVKDFAEAYNRE
ncbi:NmrA family NAD(P)-binding protein [Chitinophaga flava]|uniref:NAD-dependent dehydratase n=1 Tax=Chitinophaga flava TaxID=2259036 RepID=A0A365XV04_9BACT|nr:NAD(P)H-binding protein [Chitinophaga flava]RBL89425.1 NAD-dependent dehydratase [Chitinophaga flava]